MLLPLVSLLKKIILGKKSAIELIAERCEYGSPYIEENKEHKLLTGLHYPPHSKVELTKVSIFDGVNMMLPNKICYNNGDCLDIEYFNKNERKRREDIINKYKNIKLISKPGYIIEGD